MKRYSYILLLIIIIGTACNTSQRAEAKTGEVTEATLDSVIVHYLEELDKGENMINTTKEEYRVLDSLERQLILQLNNCLTGENLAAFKHNQQIWQEQWEQKKDSIEKANEMVTFEDGPENKEMFLTWQYAYLKELRIIELLEVRNEYCK